MAAALAIRRCDIGPGECKLRIQEADFTTHHIATMPQSLQVIHVHLVFSTKYRAPLLRDEERDRLHAYLAGIARAHGSRVIIVNSMPDHVHMLYGLSRQHPPPKVVEQIKCSSSHWLKKLDPWYREFSWQRGYGAFAVEQRNIASIRRYIALQQEHHRGMSFGAEYHRISTAAGV